MYNTYIQIYCPNAKKCCSEVTTQQNGLLLCPFRFHCSTFQNCRTMGIFCASFTPLLITHKSHQRPPVVVAFPRDQLILINKNHALETVRYRNPAASLMPSVALVNASHPVTCRKLIALFANAITQISCQHARRTLIEFVDPFHVSSSITGASTAHWAPKAF